MGAALTFDFLPYLAVNNISIFRDHSPILLNFSLTITSGEWISVRGRNGSGKSTLLKAITGLLPLQQGIINCHNFCYLGHQNGFRESMTVKEHFIFIAKFFNTPLKSTPVDHLFDLPIHHLSAGLKRQVALSQFIIVPHKLWIIDEPFEHLDQQSQTYFSTLMHNHVENGGSILMTSHEDMKEPLIKEIWLN